MKKRNTVIIVNAGISAKMSLCVDRLSNTYDCISWNGEFGGTQSGQKTNEESTYLPRVKPKKLLNFLWFVLKKEPDIILIDQFLTEETRIVMRYILLISRFFAPQAAIFTYTTKKYQLIDNEKPSIKWWLPFTAVVSVSMVVVFIAYYIGLTLAFASIAVLLIAFGIVEIGLRRSNQKDTCWSEPPSWPSRSFNNEYLNPVPLYRERHPLLGWTHSPSVDLIRSLKSVLSSDVYKFRIRTDSSGRRRSIKEMVKVSDKQPIIKILGCSYTFGIGVEDEDTYPWLLQKTLPEYRILNEGCCGYSLYQMMVSLETAIEKDTPRVVVLGLHEGLVPRLTWTAETRPEMFGTGRVLPKFTIRDGRLQRRRPVSYDWFPMSRRSEIIKKTERCWNSLRFGLHNARISVAAMNVRTILRMKEVCRSHGASLLVLCLAECPSFYETLLSNDFDWLVTSVRLTVPEESKWTLYPYDSHPNRDAHRVWAELLSANVHKLVKGDRIKPNLEEIDDWPLEGESIAGAETYPLF